MRLAGPAAKLGGPVGATVGAAQLGGAIGSRAGNAIASKIDQGTLNLGGVLIEKMLKEPQLVKEMQ